MSLEVKNIVFSYENTNRKIIDGFSAEFPMGKITALTGKNGVGKTTLSRIIMGILKAESGDIILNGIRINDMTLAQRGKHIGYVMQNPARQIFSMTVEEEMTYGLKNLGLSEDEIQRRTEKYLKYFGLDDRRKSFPFLLSHGEKQRLVLAAILSMEPEYLILDEPTASLDMKRRLLLADHLAGLDCGIIIISHDGEFIKYCCHRTVNMESTYE